MRDNRKDPTKYAVYCPRHGLAFLEHKDYTKQLMAANAFWKCPYCGLDSSWDDDCQETNPPDQELDLFGDPI